VILVFVLSINAEPLQEGRRLIAFSETESIWLTPEQVYQLALNRVHFMDITDFQNVSSIKPKVFAIPERPAFEATVNNLIQEIDVDELLGSVVRLSGFPTRYYTNTTGQQAALLLVDEYTRHSAGRDDIVVTRYQHSWLQNSVIARIQGTGPDADEIVILGGHIDSISSVGNAPGADDDASGSCTVLEVFRILATNDFKPKRTIEFHGYAADEAGLLGSQAIATDYANRGVNVFGMMQLDMTGYVRSGSQECVGVLTDNVSPQLTAFLRQLVDTYTNLPWVNTACGYACSDHASWFRNGYASSHPAESTLNNINPNIHTNRDTVTLLSPSHMVEMTKVALSYVVEMSLAE